MTQRAYSRVKATTTAERGKFPVKSGTSAKR
jgi:hypothetical protein